VDIYFYDWHYSLLLAPHSYISPFYS